MRKAGRDAEGEAGAPGMGEEWNREASASPLRCCGLFESKHCSTEVVLNIHVSNFLKGAGNVSE